MTRPTSPPSPPPAIPGRRKQRPTASSPRARWLALAGAGGAGLAAGGSADAAVVQITHSGNYLADNDTTQFNLDITRDGTVDIASGRGGIAYLTSIANVSNRVRLGASQIVMLPPSSFSFSTTSSTAFAAGAGGLGSPFVRDNRGGDQASGSTSARALVLVFFEDARINGGTQTRGMLQLASTVNGSGPGAYRITIERLIFDDADPAGAALPTRFANAAASYGEFAAIPEPSGLALLAAGAAGLLARRRRK